MPLGWWRSWSARRSHSLLSYPEAGVRSSLIPIFMSVMFFIRFKICFNYNILQKLYLNIIVVVAQLACVWVS